ncbi:DUF1642 domain-containing protein [Lactobacillus rhamnosus]|jgi:hypothetical protein|uniref:DUF1642 domain-containing protein n=1 Tax=Lacticaseibacillus rhamnosus TaxID=47715 RepID=A0A853J716_LACRH|nr:DUF1642 domain-containing protein [Lacticaseibacillus rhamnosus]WBF77256.1 hypothetical protein [Lacticaseibacillus phage R23.9]MBS5068648.1 DUF1642 domain-containing protein [Lacticaseibacillus rhamnosus]MBZ3793931.1 DUF1642 domain-containing protein [Lacticaseibacillus rhamnosus]NZA05875.1 DUF1642 domain-containing protein [Lacticaseibacillus rhamnosus]NZA30872.1 DUF1642 domain-containing protein [Lacticaseibacillus rhamnosus]
MSEEKLYAVKNRSGEFWDFSDSSGFWSLAISDFPTTPNKKQAELAAKDHGGHVVTFVEEPEKVVLSEKQAKIVEGANKSQFPASYISDHTGSSYCLEKLLMDAYANGYTVAKEKKYNVKVPHTDDSYFYKVDDEYCNAGDSYYLEGMTDKKWFTDAEIEHYGLGDCEKVWCDSDDD